jgi:hypothetical protein
MAIGTESPEDAIVKNPEIGDSKVQKPFAGIVSDFPIIPVFLSDFRTFPTSGLS